MAVNVIGTRLLRDLINAGLTRWRLMVYINGRRRGKRDEPREETTDSALAGRMSRLTRDGTTEPISRDQFLRRERG